MVVQFEVQRFAPGSEALLLGCAGLAFARLAGQGEPDAAQLREAAVTDRRRLQQVGERLGLRLFGRGIARQQRRELQHPAALSGQQVRDRVIGFAHFQLSAQLLGRKCGGRGVPGGIGPPLRAPVGKRKQQAAGGGQAGRREHAHEGLGERTIRRAA